MMKTTESLLPGKKRKIELGQVKIKIENKDDITRKIEIIIHDNGMNKPKWKKKK